MAHSKSEIRKAKNLLSKYAPKGEQLAYINPKEANLLKRMGGAGKDVNVSGIKSYYYDAAGVEGATSGGSTDSGGYGGGGGSNDNSSNDNAPQKKSLLSRALSFIGTAALTMATGGIFGLSKIGAIAAVKGARFVTKNISGKVTRVVAGPGDSYPLTNKDFGKKNINFVNASGGGDNTPPAQNVGGRIVKLSPTTAEVSQSNATDTAAYDNRKTKARGRSMTILTSSKGVTGNTGAFLGTKSLLGSV